MEDNLESFFYKGEKYMLEEFSDDGNSIKVYNLKNREKKYKLTRKLYSRILNGEDDCLVSLDSKEALVRTSLNPRIDFIPHQYKPLLKLMGQLDNDYISLFIADEVGVGKTFEVGIILSYLLESSVLDLERDKMLIASPKILTEKWREVLFNFFSIYSNIVRSKKDWLYGLDTGVNIISYNLIAGLDLDELGRESFTSIILDEAHLVNSKSSKINSRISSLCEDRDSRIKIFLSATPESGQKDSKGLEELLFKNIRDKEKGLFLEEGPYMNRTRKEEIRKGAKRRIKNIQPDPDQDLSYLDKSLEFSKLIVNPLFKSKLNYMLQSSFQASYEFLSSMRGKLSEESYLKMLLSHPSSQDELDLEFLEDYIFEEDDLEGGEEAFLEDHPIVEELDKLLDLYEKRASRKLIDQDWKGKKLIEFCNKETRDKLVIFTSFIASQNYVYELLKEELDPSYKIEGIFGDTDFRKRMELVNWFASENSGDEKKIVVLGRVGTEGLDFESASSLINYDLRYNPVILEQRIGRIDRIKQEADSLEIINFKDRSGEPIYRIIERKLRSIEEETGQYYQIINQLDREDFSEPDSLARKKINRRIYGEEEIGGIRQELYNQMLDSFYRSRSSLDLSFNKDELFSLNKLDIEKKALDKIYFSGRW